MVVQLNLAAVGLERSSISQLRLCIKAACRPIDMWVQSY